MARKKQVALRKQELISQMAHSRETITLGRAAVKDKLNVKKQVTSLVRRKPKAVFAGSAVAGLLGTMILRRPRKRREKVKKPRSNFLLGLLMLLIKPAAKKWLTKSLKSYAISKLSNLAHRQQPPLRNAQQKAQKQIH